MRCSLLSVASVVLPLTFAAAQGAPPPAVSVTRDVRISMRTGAPLKARVFRLPGNALRPAILSLENDSTAAREDEARALAAAGFAVVIAEPRGGDDKHVGRDGYDAIEWITDQPWSDRRVEMTGTGEGANAAWNAAREHPPHLVSIVSRVPARALGWTDKDLSRVFIPALTIAGAASEPQGFALEIFSAYAKPDANDAHRSSFLVVGTLGPTDFELLEQGWCEWRLGKGSPPPLLRKQVNYMVVGSDGVWLAADSLQAIGAAPTSYPLHSNAGPRAAPGGFIGESPRDDEPADTVSTSGKTYETLLGRQVNLAGTPSVTLWLDRAVASPSVSIEEIRADGHSVSLGTSLGKVKVVDSTATPGKGPARWDFTAFPWIAKELAPDSRLRLTVHGDGMVVYHDVERYSRVIIPAVRNWR